MRNTSIRLSGYADGHGCHPGWSHLRPSTTRRVPQQAIQRPSTQDVGGMDDVRFGSLTKGGNLQKPDSTVEICKDYITVRNFKILCRPYIYFSNHNILMTLKIKYFNRLIFSFTIVLAYHAQSMLVLHIKEYFYLLTSLLTKIIRQ